MSRWLIGFVTVLCLMTACKRQQKGIDWSVRLSHKDTTPYGTRIAYEAARYYFPDATIQALPGKYRYTSISHEMRYPDEGVSLLVAVGLHFQLSSDELETLLNLVRSGNEVVIFCSTLDEKLQKKLHAEKNDGSEEQRLNKGWNRGEENLAVLSLASQSERKYGYHGRYLKGYFTLDTSDKGAGLTTSVSETDTSVHTSFYNDEETKDLDTEEQTDFVTEYDEHGDTTVKPEVLGTSAGRPNFLRYAYGSGHLSVHGAPLSLSNYFLLQGDNRQYLDGLWSTMPYDISAVYWHGYYKRTAEASSFGLLWRHPATRWALILSIIALGLYVLFESKRRQRIIPIVKPLENTSVAFVETIGRLYFNSGDHANLAAKMVQHFLEWIRNTHNLQTTELNETLVFALSRKTGRVQAEAYEAIRLAREVRDGHPEIGEEYLHRLYTTFHAFYDTSHS